MKNYHQPFTATPAPFCPKLAFGLRVCLLSLLLFCLPIVPLPSSSVLHRRLQPSLRLFPRLSLLFLHLSFWCRLLSLLWLILWFLWVLLLPLHLLSSLLSLLSLRLLLLLLRRVLPLWCLWFLVPQLTFRLVLAFLRRWGGGGRRVPHVIRLLMFQVPRLLFFCPFAGPLPFRGGNQSCHKGTRGSHTLGKPVLSHSFLFVGSLFFLDVLPASKPPDSSSAVLSPLFDDFRSTRRHDPMVLLSFFSSFWLQ